MPRSCTATNCLNSSIDMELFPSVSAAAKRVYTISRSTTRVCWPRSGTCKSSSKLTNSMWISSPNRKPSYDAGLGRLSLRLDHDAVNDVSMLVQVLLDAGRAPRLQARCHRAGQQRPGLM